MIFNISGRPEAKGKHKAMQHRPAIIRIRSVMGSKINQIQPWEGVGIPVVRAKGHSGSLPPWEDAWPRKCAWSRFPGHICIRPVVDR